MEPVRGRGTYTGGKAAYKGAQTETKSAFKEKQQTTRVGAHRDRGKISQRAREILIQEVIIRSWGDLGTHNHEVI